MDFYETTESNARNDLSVEERVKYYLGDLYDTKITLVFDKDNNKIEISKKDLFNRNICLIPLDIFDYRTSEITKYTRDLKSTLYMTDEKYASKLFLVYYNNRGGDYL